MKFRFCLSAVSTFCLLSLTALAGPGVLGPVPMPSRIYLGPDATLPIWAETSSLLDEAGQVRPDVLGDAADALQQQLNELGDECLTFEDAHISYVMPPARGSLDDAVEFSRTRLLGEVTNKAYGMYSGVLPGQLIQVAPLTTYGEPLPDKHYYFFVPIGRFTLGNRLICKEDSAYAEPPEVGGQVFLFLAGPPRGRDENFLMTTGPGDIVPVEREGSLRLPKTLVHPGKPATVVPKSKAELLRRLEHLFPQKGGRQ